MVGLPVSAQDVADYLNGLERTSAAPVVVRIGRTSYVGAVYSQVRDVLEGSRAHAAGERTYVQNALYLVGALPASYVRSSHVAYRFADGCRQWYVAGWFDRDAPNTYHPFGRMFQLMPASAGSLVDDDGAPYSEMTMRLVSW